MLEFNAELSMRKQCAILDVARSRFYYKPILNDESALANLIMEAYLSSDCRYGYRKVTKVLHAQGQQVNKKKVLKLMQEMQIQGLYPRRTVQTSIPAPEHHIYPYLLDGLEITRPNQVWATDLTYIRLNGFFMYFIAIIDLYSRYIVGYDLSHSLEAVFCVATLRNALAVCAPEIFNSDQGVQFTSKEFVLLLQAARVEISMDHKGRCFDNIFIERLWRTLKQEAIYFYRPETIKALETCLSDFVVWYNESRLHQSLGYKTPASVYLS